MRNHIEFVHLQGYSPAFNMPYTAGIKVVSGKLVFISGVTAAPIYHHHPHRPEEFEDIPEDPGEQAQLAMEALLQVLQAAGATLEDIVSVTRYIRDIEMNQDAINRVVGRYFGDHRPTSTTVEVVRMATDSRVKFEISAIAVVPG